MDSSPADLPMPDAVPRMDQETDTVDAEAALKELNDTNLSKLLNEDMRPIFVLDMQIYAHGERLAIRPIYCNKALKQRDELLDNITRGPIGDLQPDNDSTTHDGFRIWATKLSHHNDSRDVFPLMLQYQDLLWTSLCIATRWQIIVGHAIFPDENSAGGRSLSASAPRGDKKTSKADYDTKETAEALSSAAAIPTHEILDHVQQPKFPPVNLEKDRTKDPTPISSITLTTPDSSVPDWTVSNPKGVLSEHLQFVRSVDWAKTPLGAMDTWSVQFREIMCLVMRNPHPSSVFWGEDLTMLYNESYRDVTGSKHPALMGTGFSGPFREMWHAVGPVFRESARTGHSQLNHNQPLPIERYGYMEEAFFTWTIVPVFGGTDRILGFYLNAFDTTIESIGSRRMWLLRHLGQCMSATRTVKEFWGRVLDGLQHNDYDVPFALLYSVVESDDGDTKSISISRPTSPSPANTSPAGGKLEGSIGVPPGHPVSPDTFDLRGEDEGLIPAFKQAMRTLEPIMLRTKDGTLPESLLEGIEWRGYGDPCREALLLPLRPTNADNVCALLLLGINPRRAYDQEYRSFTAMLNRHIATSLASVLLFEDEVRRSKHAAEVATLQREQLSQQLQLQTIRMRRMTELSPLGMYLYDPDGRLLEANERYYEMTGFPRERSGYEHWSAADVFLGESKKTGHEMWEHMIRTKQPISRELRFRDPQVRPRDLHGEPIEFWVLASSQPELGPNGELMSIMGSIIDISHIKWAQGLQERRLREAEEAKRQQNEFIDITSHEMRNPLSAISICADDIRDTLTHHAFSRRADQQVAADCIEAAKTIGLCVQHQKAIVDDILTVSKLDSNLLRITPVPVQPVDVVQRAMSMFRAEMQSKKIESKFVAHEQFEELGIDWVLLDPSRLLQIIINLITNAIKFTRDRPKRSISVHVCAHAEQPEFDVPKGFEFVPERNGVMNFASGEGWGSGQLLYLRFEVRDTGCGLTSEQKSLLFEKFAQASPRTHMKYGGSGLGLFISRQLAELHGGQIGVASEKNVGSTFGFYLKCRRLVPDKSTQPHEILKESLKPSPPQENLEESLKPSPPQENLEESLKPNHTVIANEVAATVADINDDHTVKKDVSSNDVSQSTNIKVRHPRDDIPHPIENVRHPTEKGSRPIKDITHSTKNVPEAANQPPPPSHLHILVVEDNLINQKVLKKQLIKADCTVSTADNGLLALEHVNKTHFRTPNGLPLDIILMDCEMPLMDGLTCCRKIRAMQHNGEITGHVPIIAVTANIRGGQLEDAKSAGMDDVIGKPFRIPDVLVKVRRLLERLDGGE